MAGVLKQLSLVTLSGATAQQITTTQTIASSVLVYAVSTNTGAGAVGDSAVTLTNAGMLLAAGKYGRINAVAMPSGSFEKIDLSTLYIIGTSGDKFQISYTKSV